LLQVKVVTATIATVITAIKVLKGFDIAKELLGYFSFEEPTCFFIAPSTATTVVDSKR
jgi:hypothetical protein